ncbi:N-terminal domain of Peptidase_S41 [Aquimarina amphilecti]|uniref:N-terminal domain of Peptidase_S41 n=1 Tax=Aquimarina amphilecti TaxID=1038014 RepID=A0A1H7QWD8_AQUAM|nr:S41 family peptidase [Aquimarina amphilecti]SEL52320.1 N-terminal domain of Peptidase_S41 [Aquimarina amphilecti]
MIVIRKYFFLLSTLLLCHTTINSQDIELSEKYKKEVISTLSKLMNDRYVFPDVAKKTEEHLKKQFDKKHFDQFVTNESFAEALTKSVQSINNDKHMKIMSQPPYEQPSMTPERLIEEKIYNLKRKKEYNAGFNNVKVLEGNIGYLDLRGFTYYKEGKIIADAYMKLISNTDAVIIDLSKNGGGDPDMVKYLCSYFFKGGVHLNSLYFREGNKTIDFYTLDKVDGTKMIDVPLFVITSKRTFSGAEEFSYNMQTQKRATLVGQTTGGGANPGGTNPINEFLSVFIPTGKAINPITKTNWEGVGVVPEIKVSSDESLNKTHELAKTAADQYRKKLKEFYTNTFINLLSKLENYDEVNSEKNILTTLKDCKEKGIIEEWEINALGYQYLMEHKKSKIAMCIFKANTILHPESANGFDSYAEALMELGNYDKSIKNYKKAVELATADNSPDLSVYQENLKKALQKK